ncbi:hypothetical protein C1877_05190 [Gordonibacter pamelaeae]|uniref:Uncharacterized protein n=1 Tax=Gordonibacter pamelaeae TaxID=471189 RepID=A0A369M190_9ACTN|nr:hypothetical protein C1877_05190 [Gordonibacter pamelaeae]
MSASGSGRAQSLGQSCSHEQPTGLFGSCGTRLVGTARPLSYFDLLERFTREARAWLLAEINQGGATRSVPW